MGFLSYYTSSFFLFLFPLIHINFIGVYIIKSFRFPHFIFFLFIHIAICNVLFVLALCHSWAGCYCKTNPIKTVFFVCSVASLKTICNRISFNLYFVFLVNVVFRECTADKKHCWRCILSTSSIKCSLMPFIQRVYIPKALRNALAMQLMDNAFPDHRLNGILCV